MGFFLSSIFFSAYAAVIVDLVEYSERIWVRLSIAV